MLKTYLENNCNSKFYSMLSTSFQLFSKTVSAEFLCVAITSNLHIVWTLAWMKYQTKATFQISLSLSKLTEKDTVSKRTWTIKQKRLSKNK